MRHPPETQMKERLGKVTGKLLILEIRSVLDHLSCGEFHTPMASIQSATETLMRWDHYRLDDPHLVQL